mmetsp:Transcript_6083/g.17745  ORF Transcript_6083/g.17745 Transcript_6083/m.17745 type:complete len:83 (+) Transcript_6083:469-717(+)
MRPHTGGRQPRGIQVGSCFQGGMPLLLFHQERLIFGETLQGIFAGVRVPRADVSCTPLKFVKGSLSFSVQIINNLIERGRAL